MDSTACASQKRSYNTGCWSLDVLQVEGGEEEEQEDDAGQGKDFQAELLAVLKCADDEFHDGLAQQEDANHGAEERADGK